MPKSQAAPLEFQALCTALNDCLGPRLGAALSVCAQWPAMRSADSTRNDRGVTVRLVLGASQAAPELWLWIDSALAANLVDRALGGRGELGVATAAATLSEAECGVLAYLAARVAHTLGSVWVRDVSTDGPSSQGCEWPLRVQIGNTTGIARVGLCPEINGPTLPCWLAFREVLSDADAQLLAPGDLLTLDELPLSVTTQGLSAPCSLVSPGLATWLPVLLDGGRLCARDGARPQSAFADDTWLIAHETQLALRELAKLTDGGSLGYRVDPSASFGLIHRQERLASGVLVRHRGRLALEVTGVAKRATRALLFDAQA